MIPELLVLGCNFSTSVVKDIFPGRIYLYEYDATNIARHEHKNHFVLSLLKS